MISLRKINKKKLCGPLSTCFQLFVSNALSSNNQMLVFYQGNWNIQRILLEPCLHRQSHKNVQNLEMFTY